ncbi:hypothetical protein [Aurantimonas sp. HBX-1]|uniref:hypothetical protein n=1 Tax=Aurantimonas sp. HBX-1 TaxID=2906072 RepID=UPI001F32A928|nr:hypothetical protein [Aurantimonas sp. HBX-1]UIJ70327.1 hypothetical protein LXB15_11100 [Aurantimonas sp. HBX-1]
MIPKLGQYFPEVPERLYAPLQRAVDRAALMGAFNPLELIDEVKDPEGQRLLLGTIGTLSKELPGREPVWQLQADARRELLRDLSDRGELEEMAGQARTAPDDRLGRFLVAMLRGDTVLPGAVRPNELDALHTAIEFARDVRAGIDGPQKVETILAQRDFDESIEFLLPRRFIGRRSALSRLQRFVQSGAQEEVIGFPAIPTGVVSGIGGAGKSALLAEFVRRQRRTPGVPIIWLDFDRASLASADPLDLSAEFSRQLARWRPDLAGALSEYRNFARDLSLESVLQEMSFEASARGASEAWSMWRNALGGHLPIKETVVLILDTFEEILLREPLELERVLLWVAALHEEGGLRNLRPILSGRAIPENLEFPSRFAAPRRITIDDLSQGEAADLLADDLERLGAAANRFPVQELAERFGGNPLLLKILARYCKNEGAEAARELLAGEGNRFGKEFGQAFLYDRILKRIRSDDPVVKELAHPGLVLRRITPDLIRSVLAEPCGLGDIDSSRASGLFDALAEQVWLVEPLPGQRAVRHRRDLRGLMLKAMTDSQSEKVREIHRRAHQYYADRCDMWLNEREQHDESLYHFYMSGGREQLRGEDAAAFIRRIGQDLEDLPVGARANLKVRVGRSLTEEEVGALDNDLRDRHEAERLKQRATRGTASNDKAASVAYQSSDALRMPHARAVPGESLTPLIEIRLAQADFAWLRDAFHPAFEEFRLLLTEGIKPRNLPADLTQLPLWRVAMISLREPAFIDRLDTALHSLETRRWNIPLVRGRKFSGAAAVAALLGLVGRPYPDWLPPTDLLAAGRLRSADELRLLQVSGPERPRTRSRIRVKLDLLAYLSPEALRDISATGGWPSHIGSYFRSILAARPVTLADIRRFRSEESDVDIALLPGHALPPALRGMTTEIHPAVRAVLDVAPWRAVEIAAELDELHPFWPSELRGTPFHDALQRDRQRWLATFIECADRLGELDRVVSAIAGVDARGAELGRIWYGYDQQLRRRIG